MSSIQVVKWILTQDTFRPTEMFCFCWSNKNWLTVKRRSFWGDFGNIGVLLCMKCECPKSKLLHFLNTALLISCKKKVYGRNLQRVRRLILDIFGHFDWLKGSSLNQSNQLRYNWLRCKYAMWCDWNENDLKWFCLTHQSLDPFRLTILSLIKSAICQ